MRRPHCRMMGTSVRHPQLSQSHMAGPYLVIPLRVVALISLPVAERSSPVPTPRVADAVPVVGAGRDPSAGSVLPRSSLSYVPPREHLHPWGMLCILLPQRTVGPEEVAPHPALRSHVFALRSLASGLIHCLFQLFMWGIRRDSSWRTLHSRGPAAVIRSLSLHRIMFLHGSWCLLRHPQACKAHAQRTLADLHHGV